MLTDALLEQILERIPGLTLGVLGDLFLDRYLDIDPALTEKSIETGLDAYQVVKVRPSPGAAGTIINNLAALGVGKIHVIAVIGADGEGYELGRALDALKVDQSGLIVAEDADFHTPTYTKPLLRQDDEAPKELNRLDIKNRQPLPEALEGRIVDALSELWPSLDGLLVLDQVSEANCGMVTARVREKLAELGESDAKKIILADSRERTGEFRWVWMKPNEAECVRALHPQEEPPPSVEFCAVELSQRTHRPVFCTRGDAGILLADPKAAYPWPRRVPAFPVEGPTDIVGAGDSASAALACALASGTRPKEAAAFANLIASITIQQIGTTGTATPEQIRARWQQVRPPQVPARDELEKLQEEAATSDKAEDAESASAE